MYRQKLTISVVDVTRLSYFASKAKHKNKRTQIV